MIHRQLAYLIFGILLLCVSCKKSVHINSGKPQRADSLLAKATDPNLDIDVRENYLDTLYEETMLLKNDSIVRYYLKKTAVNYYTIESYNKSLTVSKKFYNLSKEVEDTLNMARGLYIEGSSYYGNSYNERALSSYRKSEELYASLKNPDPTEYGAVILYKAYIFYDAGEYVLAETEAFKALKLLSQSNSYEDIYSCYNLIATSLDGQNNDKDAIYYYELGLDVLEKHKEDYKQKGYTDNNIDYLKATSYNNMGGVYVKMKQFKTAISIYEKALAFPVTKEVPMLHSKVMSNVAMAKVKSGIRKNIPELFYKSLAIRDSLNDESGIVSSNVSLGEYYLSEKDTLKALEHLTKAYQKAEAINSNNDVLNSLKLLSNIDRVNNDYYIRRYIKVNDSLQQIAQNTRNKFARIEYDTDRIITEKEALAKKNSFILGVSIVVVLFIAAIFIIYYLNSKNKELLLIQEQQKANEEVYELMFEQQGKIETAKTEEKSRIAMELHDGILNNIYAVRLNLEFINKKADEESILKRKEYIKELQNVEAEIRGVSHDLSRNALFNQEQSFENILAFMIVSQKNTFSTEFEAEISKEIEWDNTSNVCKVNVYRIIQEALQNINKYSEASHVKVSVQKKEDDIKILIIDNGIGFEPEKAKGGIGLKNLKKRADALNGTLQITSAPGNGTVVDVTFPFQY